MRCRLSMTRNLTHCSVSPNVICVSSITLISFLAPFAPSHFTWFNDNSKCIQHSCLKNNNNNPCVKTAFLINKKENLPSLLHPPIFYVCYFDYLDLLFCNIRLFTLPLRWEESIVKGIHELQKHARIYYYFENYWLFHHKKYHLIHKLVLFFTETYIKWLFF